MPKHELRASSATERPHKSYKLIMVTRQKAHKGNKILHPT